MLRTRRSIEIVAALGGLIAGRVPLGAQALAAQEFRIDAAHSSIEFEVPFMYSRVRGRFDDIRGSVLLADSTNGGVVRSVAMAVIRTASINTGSAHRDDHLRSSDFFDAQQYPSIIFRTEQVTGSAHDFALLGTLTMHGHTRRIRVPCRLTLSPVHDPHNVVIAQIDGSTTIARKDFGIVGGDAHNPWFDQLRSAMMGDSVRITLEVHLWAPDVTNPDSQSRAAIAMIDSIGIDSAITRLRKTYARDSAAVQGAQYTIDAVGQTLIARNRIREAFLWLHAAARLLTHSADAMVDVGLANARMGDTTRARAWYDQARALDSLNARAYVYARGWL